MRISPDARPRLGVIAMGSGNDFARTLGVPFNDPEESLHSLLRAQETSYDLGLVDAGTPDARYFMETLSFGLDAAIALDTTDRRIAQTKQQGAGLFVTSGIRIMSQAHRGWPYRAVLVDTEGTRQVLVGTEVIFAIQNGPTYGGGFRIAPDASPHGRSSRPLPQYRHSRCPQGPRPLRPRPRGQARRLATRRLPPSHAS